MKSGLAWCSRVWCSGTLGTLQRRRSSCGSSLGAWTWCWKFEMPGVLTESRLYLDLCLSWGYPEWRIHAGNARHMCGNHQSGLHVRLMLCLAPDGVQWHMLTVLVSFSVSVNTMDTTCCNSQALAQDTAGDGAPAAAGLDWRQAAPAAAEPGGHDQRGGSGSVGRLFQDAPAGRLLDRCQAGHRRAQGMVQHMPHWLRKISVGVDPKWYSAMHLTELLG